MDYSVSPSVILTKTMTRFIVAFLTSLLVCCCVCAQLQANSIASTIPLCRGELRPNTSFLNNASQKSWSSPSSNADTIVALERQEARPASLQGHTQTTVQSENTTFGKQVYMGDTLAKKPYYLTLKTNLLYDALAVPNIGAEIYLGRRTSLAFNWMYSWWHSDRLHYYWRTYGGDLELRRYLGRKTKNSPLLGHHAGVYAGIVTYDFELGGEGYLANRWSYFGGVSYGYTCPLTSRLNMDFTIGLGYLGGQYKTYIPKEECYMWRSTRQRHWFGPTKAEISLIWLLGRGHHNQKKGGKR